MAIQRVKEGERPSEVIASYGLCRTSIYRWLRDFRSKGIAGIKLKRHPGRSPKLDIKQQLTVQSWIIGKDPRSQGMESGLWTRAIVSQLIKQEFEINISLNSVGKLLRNLGIVPLKPLRRAYERDPVAIDIWKRDTYPAIRTRAKLINSEIFFLDEAGIRSDSPLQRTWGLKGRKAIVKTSGQRQSINAISAVSDQGGFWFELYTGKLNAESYIGFLSRFMRYRKRPIILIVDGHPSHRAKIVIDYIRSLKGKLEMHLLPPYAPDLNPDEFVWNYVRLKGTGRRPLKRNESLKERVEKDLAIIRNDKRLCKSFFRAPSVAYTTA
jgi:transposase